MAKLTLVGAGPGDTELITLKGLKAIQTADVILYDALVNKELLSYASSNCLQLFVGKKFGFCHTKQEEINLLNVQYALKYGNVVRLKGGDPFVFGRGYEEIEYAQAFSIDTEVIPGISSCMAVPASEQIPVTHRGLSRSFTVVTATTKSHELSTDIYHAANMQGTVVILMGMSKLESICEIFGTTKGLDTPIAIIQNGTCTNQQSVIGTISDICEKVKQQAITNPAIILIGEVVKLHQAFAEKKYVLKIAS